MAAPVVDTFYGTTVAFTTATALNSLQLIDINWSPGDRTYTETTHYGTGAVGAAAIGNATKIASKVVDAGSFSFTYHFNPDTEDIGDGAETDTCTITWPDSGTWAFSCAYHPTAGTMPMKEPGTIDLHVECLGAITVTDAA